MRIAFKFHYIHDNGLFIRLLNRIAERAELPLGLYHEGHDYRIEASGEQRELEILAELISSLVPQSLFLHEYAIEEVHQEEEDEGTVTFLPNENMFFQLPSCLECQNKVIETYNPFVECAVCGFSDLSLEMEDLMSHTGISAETGEQFFIQAADLLLEKGELTLPTYNGLRCFSLLSGRADKNEGVLFCDPKDISDKFLITPGELDALLMVEKPTVRLKAKLMFRSEYELNDPFYPVFFADDKITLALSTALKEKGIDAVFCDKIPTLRVVSALDEHVIISVGRDMLPWKVSTSLRNTAFCEYGGFQAYGDENGLVLDTKLDIGDRSFIRYISNEKKLQGQNTIEFEPAHAALRSVVLEHALDAKALFGVYLSREHPTQIFSFSEKIGYSPMVQLSDEVLMQPKHMLDAISEMDEGGERLVNNFKKTFPELSTKVEQLHFNTHSNTSALTKLWAIAAVFIGLYEGDDRLKACETLESTAIEFGGKSGPRIDYKIMASQDGYQLDMRLAIRSAMSFKLAGLDEYLLSFGFIDSLADFIAMQAEDSDANIGIDGVALSGSLFENRQLLMRTYNALSANYPIYRNERLSIDGANISLGAITLGSE
jgi:hypothetical protein